MTRDNGPNGSEIWAWGTYCRARGVRRRRRPKEKTEPQPGGEEKQQILKIIEQLYMLLGNRGKSCLCVCLPVCLSVCRSDCLSVSVRDVVARQEGEGDNSPEF